MIDGEIDGRGKFTWPNGKIYEGDFSEGIKEGAGRLTYPDGKVHIGLWDNGKKTGIGKAVTKDGKVTYGVWSNDRMFAKKTEVDWELYKAGKIDHNGDIKRDYEEEETKESSPVKEGEEWSTGPEKKEVEWQDPEDQDIPPQEYEYDATEQMGYGIPSSSADGPKLAPSGLIGNTGQQIKGILKNRSDQDELNALME